MNMELAMLWPRLYRAFDRLMHEAQSFSFGRVSGDVWNGMKQPEVVEIEANGSSLRFQLEDPASRVTPPHPCPRCGAAAIWVRAFRAEYSDGKTLCSQSIGVYYVHENGTPVCLAAHPSNILALVRRYLPLMTMPERETLFRDVSQGYCRHCGTEDPRGRCSCENDE